MGNWHEHHIEASLKSIDATLSRLEHLVERSALQLDPWDGAGLPATKPQTQDHTTAIFMAIGLATHPDIKDICHLAQEQGVGQLELYQALAEFAAIADDFYEAAAVILPSPGVFAYDVCEDFGHHFGDHVLEHDAEIHHNDMLRALAKNVQLFFLLGLQTWQQGENLKEDLDAALDRVTIKHERT